MDGMPVLDMLMLSFWGGVWAPIILGMQYVRTMQTAAHFALNIVGIRLKTLFFECPLFIC
jgi:hypothetical protein